MNLNVMGAIAIDNLLKYIPKSSVRTRFRCSCRRRIYYVNNIIAKAVVNLQITIRKNYEEVMLHKIKECDTILIHHHKSGSGTS